MDNLIDGLLGQGLCLIWEKGRPVGLRWGERLFRSQRTEVNPVGELFELRNVIKELCEDRNVQLSDEKVAEINREFG